MVSKEAFADGLYRSVKADGGNGQGRAGRFGGREGIESRLGVDWPPVTYASGMTQWGNSWTLGEISTEAGLGRDPEKKPGCGAAVSVKKSFNDPFGVPPGRPRPQGKGHEVA